MLDDKRGAETIVRESRPSIMLMPGDNPWVALPSRSDEGRHSSEATLDSWNVAVTARFLLALFDSVYVMAMSAWVGSLLFMTWGVIPILLPALGNEAGGRLIRVLYPRLYTWSATSGAIALPAYFGVPLSFPEYRGPLIAFEALAILGGILLMFYAGNTLTPAIIHALGSGPSQESHCDRLQRRLFATNLMTTAIGLALLIAFANRPAPKTKGIIEGGPRVRASLVPPKIDADRAVTREKTKGMLPSPESP